MALPAPHEIEVIPFPLDEEIAMPLAVAREWLSDDERVRADRFHFAIHRERFLRGRAMLRYLLAGYLGTGPGEIHFETGERGKPYLGGSKVHFNLSHSGNRAVLAVSQIPSIGIDIECFDRRVNVDALSRRCFRESEILNYQGLSEGEKRRAFFWIWTAKEARMKATGEGMHLEPQRIEIGFENGLPGTCFEPAFPRAYLAPLILPAGGTACTVVALSPFSAVLAEVPAIS